MSESKLLSYPGMTIVVGSGGSGKTHLIKYIMCQEWAYKESTPKEQRLKREKVKRARCKRNHVE